jgi:hypothetical protein
MSAIDDLPPLREVIRQHALKGRYRASPQAADWVGKAAAEAMHLDLSKPSDKRKAANLLKVWTSNGALKRIEERDEKGNDRGANFIQPPCL